jgi:hypothetical protein
MIFNLFLKKTFGCFTRQCGLFQKSTQTHPLQFTLIFMTFYFTNAKVVCLHEQGPGASNGEDLGLETTGNAQ